MDCKVTWPWGFPLFLIGHSQPPRTVLTAGKLPAVSAVQGDCETVSSEWDDTARYNCIEPFFESIGNTWWLAYQSYNRHNDIID